MKMKTRGYSSSIIIIILFLSIITKWVHADENQQTGGEKAVFFLLDSSGSMLTNDPNRLAIDSIAQLIYTLPSDYRVGFVSYNSEVIVSQVPVENALRSQIMLAAEQVAYHGYSNAGAGLNQAVSLLKEDSAAEKIIVLLSDGEILMDDDTMTAESLIMYQNAISQAAESGIIIHTIGLGKEMENTEVSIFSAASKTNGGIYHAPLAVDIQTSIDSILNEQLHIKQTTAAIVDTDGEVESLSLDLPFAHANKVRILLTSNASIQNLKTNFQADSANQINGERYSLIEIDKPTGTNVDLSFQGAPGERVRITMIPEYQVISMVNIEYMDSVPDVPEGEEATLYDRTASISYTFYDAENQNIQLWQEAFFQHHKLPITVDGEIKDTALKDGMISLEEFIIQEKTENVVFDYSMIPVNVIGTEQMQIYLEGAPALPELEPLPEPEPEPPYLWIGVGCGGILLLILLIIWRLTRKKPEPPIQTDVPVPGKYSYTGKLNIYITRTRSGYDIPPLSYNLFRLPTGKVISLRDMLDSCEVKEIFDGADKIYLKAGAGRCLILTNNSDCTIMKNREILMKNKSYQLPMGAKVDITFEDEVGELTFQYKDLKPSEMR